MTIALLDAADAQFDARLSKLLARDAPQTREVAAAVAAIIDAVRRDGDAAVTHLTAKYEHRDLDAAHFEVPRARQEAALDSLDADVAHALRVAAQRIEAYHAHEVQQSWQFTDAHGATLGQRITPLARVGVYVPGGAAAYPSSVLMTVIPARVAGVDEIIMTAPAPDGVHPPAVLAAAALAGVDRVFALGGAQAIAALAYGTARVPAVDKIVGPGNRYVAEAKRQVFGKVGIDVIAGPSEVVVICDAAADSDWVAMDLFAQAEHDARAQSIAITDNHATAQAVLASVNKMLPSMRRREIIGESLLVNGAIICAGDLTRAVAIANRIAPEHLELMVANPDALLDQVRHAGAVFIGAHSAEAFGDYCAGANHVLPTAGAAKFSSPLGVSDFQKRTSIVRLNETAAAQLAPIAATLARCEGLDAHARSAEYRAASPKSSSSSTASTSSTSAPSSTLTLLSPLAKSSPTSLTLSTTLSTPATLTSSLSPLTKLSPSVTLTSLSPLSKSSPTSSTLSTKSSTPATSASLSLLAKSSPSVTLTPLSKLSSATSTPSTKLLTSVTLTLLSPLSKPSSSSSTPSIKSSATLASLSPLAKSSPSSTLTPLSPLSKPLSSSSTPSIKSSTTSASSSPSTVLTSPSAQSSTSSTPKPQ